MFTNKTIILLRRTKKRVSPVSACQDTSQEYVDRLWRRNLCPTLKTTTQAFSQQSSVFSYETSEKLVRCGSHRSSLSTPAAANPVLVSACTYWRNPWLSHNPGIAGVSQRSLGPVLCWIPASAGMTTPALDPDPGYTVMPDLISLPRT